MKYFETFFDTCVRRQNRIFPTDDTKQTPEKWNSVDRDKPIKLEKQKESNKIELNWIWSYFSEVVFEWMRSFSPIIFAVANSSRQPASNSNEKKQLCVIFVSTNVVQRWKKIRRISSNAISSWRPLQDKFSKIVVHLQIINL